MLRVHLDRLADQRLRGEDDGRLLFSLAHGQRDGNPQDGKAQPGDPGLHGCAWTSWNMSFSFSRVERAGASESAKPATRLWVLLGTIGVHGSAAAPEDGRRSGTVERNDPGHP